MVYSTAEHYNIGQLRPERLTIEENSVNHVNDRYYKLKSPSVEGEYNVTLIGKYINSVIKNGFKIIK